MMKIDENVGDVDDGAGAEGLDEGTDEFNVEEDGGDIDDGDEKLMMTVTIYVRDVLLANDNVELSQQMLITNL